MKLYKEYIEEREGFHCIILEDIGFLTYKIYGKDFYIRDIFVNSCSRREGFGEKLLQLAITEAQNEECNFLIGSVCPAANNAHESMMAIIHNGFKLFKIDGGLILFRRAI